MFKVKKTEETSKLIENINYLSKIYEKANRQNSRHFLEGIEQSKEKRIIKINKLNFFKELELFDFNEIDVSLQFEKFELKARFNIYEINKE